MHQEFSEAFWLGVETLATTILLVMVLMIGRSSQQLSDVIEQQNATAKLLQETREWAAYDGTSGLYEADVLSIYYKYGSNAVRTPSVITVDGFNLKGASEVDALNAVQADKKYRCVIQRDITNVVTAVTFTGE